MKIDIEKIQKEKPINELLEFSIINLDKPTGPTSFTVDQIVQKYLGLRKTSHFGTLDPQVTGVLPVALNRACKLTGYFIGGKKEYVGIMSIHSEVSEKELNSKIKQLTGKIKQLPPVKSNVKREEREREVFTFKILEKNNKEYIFKTEVEAGTYIRKLIHDLGESLPESSGAHMLELRRTKASIFQEDDSVDLYKLHDAINQYKNKGNEKPLREILIPAEIISQILPTLQIKSQSLNRLYHGSPLFIKDLKNEKELKITQSKDEKISIFNDDKFIGVFRLSSSPQKNQNSPIAYPEFVLQPIKQ